jgi:hypothetical protein
MKTDQQDKGNFERLMREGSSTSNAKAKSRETKTGFFLLLVITSFLASLASPVFWVVFLLALIVAGIYACREFIG